MIDNKSALVQIMARHRSGDQPLYEPLAYFTMAYFTDAFMRHTA